MSSEKRRVLVVIMDGIGERKSSFGNAVKLAYTPSMNWLRKHAMFRTLKAHGTHVGLPSDSDIGNSEVGHNALGSGRIYEQGAKLIQSAIKSGQIFAGRCWQDLTSSVISKSSTLHFIGLLSDGNVHSHEEHLYAMLRRAKKDGVKKVRLHILLDGRDVGEKSAEKYLENLDRIISELISVEFDVKIASGGGRMTTTMDRYEADWSIVKRGWDAHVHGKAEDIFSSVGEAIKFYRQDSKLLDQYIPTFVVHDKRGPVGKIKNGDSVILFNFRGDRAIQISRAFSEEHFPYFDRGDLPQVNFAGIMEYDGDLHIPRKFLVTPPQISDTLGEYLVSQGIRQFACSETQKFGHVTYFWNGNRSGKFDDKLEEYLEIPSDNIQFDLKPWMKAHEITDETISRMLSKSFDFARINFPNGDMVGHTGNLQASVTAVSVVDLCLTRLILAAQKSNTALVVTADHGNCDEMFESNKGECDDWMEKDPSSWPSPKTAHTLNEVPLYIYVPSGVGGFQLRQSGAEGIGNVASTVIDLLGLPRNELYLPSLLEKL